MSARYSEAHLEHLADEADKAFRADFLPCAREAAKAELIAECRQPGTEANAAWIEFCAECRDVTAKDFVDGAIGWALLDSRVDEVLNDYREGMEYEFV